MAWDVFGEGNGAPTMEAVRARVARLSGSAPAAFGMDRPIGCVSIAFPTFFPPGEWVPVPPDWQRNIVRGRTYDLAEGHGRALWEQCLERATASTSVDEWTAEAAEQLRYGAPQVVTPRLGQGSFRLAVLDAYGRSCAVTTEHSLPVLDASHIRPYAQGGEHEVSNGLPLRRDLHRLYDLGYVTVRPDRRFAVSSQLRNDYANGRVYYELEGREILAPRDPGDRPDRALLEWHYDVVFRGA
jgi:putative restriction endonuclease